MSFQTERAQVYGLFADDRISEEKWLAMLAAIDAREAAKNAAPPPPPPKVARFEAPEASRNYAQASEALYADRRMNDTARRLVLLLVQLARGRPDVDAFIDQLAERLGRSPRMVRYAQERAAQCGYIAIRRVREGRINDANVYTLLPPSRPTGRPSPAVGPSTRPARRRSRPVGVQNFASHEERLTTPPLTPPENRGGDRKGGPLVAAQLAPSIPGSPEQLDIEDAIGRLTPGAKLLGRRERANPMPPTGPP